MFKEELEDHYFQWEHFDPRIEDPFIICYKVTNRNLMVANSIQFGKCILNGVIRNKTGLYSWFLTQSFINTWNFQDKSVFHDL